MHSKKITVRFASAVSAAVIGFTSTAISFFDCPVYAAYGGAAWGEFFGFYSLLEGFGFGQDNTDFINSVDNWIDSLQPEEKPREDYDGEWMTDAQYWQQCQYDKFTGWLDNLVDSWSESYDAVGDVGSSILTSAISGWSFSNFFKVASDFDYLVPSGGCFFRFDYLDADKGHEPVISYFEKDGVFYLGLFYYANSRYVLAPGFYSTPNNFSTGSFIDLLGKNYFISSSSEYGYCQSMFSSGRHDFGIDAFCLWSDVVSLAQYLHIYSDSPVSYYDISGLLNSDLDWCPYVSESFIGPVYTYPAAQELARQNKTSTGIRLDVKTADGVPDVKAALDGAGVSTVDELAASVAAGDVAMQDVFADAKVTPYVVADTASGVVVTDLGVAADAAGVKPVALTKELTVPADLTTAATYAIQGKTWDPDMAKYRLPLFQYFPFCLPWDIYQVLTSFAADPVAPQIEIPIGKFFANKKSFDGSAVANYTATLDLGDEKFSKWFSALRLLESAGIIIGLVLISVHLIHGGR